MAVFEIKPASVAPEKAKEMEWLMTNSLGGYSSGTITGRATRLYHGMLVSSLEDFKRIVVFRGVKECLSVDGEKHELTENSVEKFEYSPDMVSFTLLNEFAKITKKFKAIPEENGIILSYEIRNKVMQSVALQAEILLSCMVIDKEKQCVNKKFSTELLNDHAFGIDAGLCYSIILSDRALCFHENSTDRKECSVHFSLELRPNEDKTFRIIAFSSENKEKMMEKLKTINFADKADRMLSSGVGVPIMTLLANVKQFLVKRETKLGIIAGYPYYGEIGRDAMLSLPGLTFTTSRTTDAEMIFERYLNVSTLQGVPSGFSDGKPVYGDMDTFLWLIDRLYSYMNHVGEERFKKFLHTYWWNLKDVMKSYAEKEKNGFLMHEGKTWMLSEKREAAVEIQGLWYNALRIMDKFSKIMGEYDAGMDYAEYAKKHEENFLKEFWTGYYLKDSLRDNTLRPNQLILAALNFNVLPEGYKKSILSKVSEELLTPYGIRTLGKKHTNFNSKDKFNGAAVPWLLGPFIKMYVEVHGQDKSYGFLKRLFEEQINYGCIGTLPEFFDSETYEPLGCISYAPSVAELLRTYFEDVMGKKLCRQP